MLKSTYVCAALSICGSAFAAEPELTPAQEEARTTFEAKLEEPLKTMNERCGTKVAIKTDFQSFKKEEWGNRGVYSWCQNVVQTISRLCVDRPAYKKALATKLNGISCVFSGVKPAEKKDGTNHATLRNMSFDKGEFTFHMFPDGMNIPENAKTVLEKSLN